MIEPPADSFPHVAEEPVLSEMHDLNKEISFLRDNFGSVVASKIYNLFKSHIANIQIAVVKENSKLLRGISEIFKESQRSQDEMEHITQSEGLDLWENQDMKVAEKISTQADRCNDSNAHVDELDLPVMATCKSSLINNCDAPDGMDPEAALEKEVSYIASMSQKKESIHVHKDMAQGDHKGTNSRKRKGEGEIATKNPEVTHNKSRKKLDHEHTLSKRQGKYSESEADDWFEEDESMQSDNEDKEDEDKDEEADGEEDDHDPKKVKSSKKSSERKVSASKRKVMRGDVPVATVSKHPSKVSSSSRSYTKKKSPGAHARFFSGKSKSIAPKRTMNSEKDTSKVKSSGKMLATNKEKSAEAEDIPSKDDLQKAIVQIVKKVDHTTTTFSDIFEMLDGHYKMDLSSRKSSIKLMIQNELTRYPSSGGRLGVI